MGSRTTRPKKPPTSGFCRRSSATCTRCRSMPTSRHALTQPRPTPTSPRRHSTMPVQCLTPPPPPPTFRSLVTWRGSPIQQLYNVENVVRTNQVVGHNGGQAAPTIPPTRGAKTSGRSWTLLKRPRPLPRRKWPGRKVKHHWFHSQVFSPVEPALSGSRLVIGGSQGRAWSSLKQHPQHGAANHHAGASVHHAALHVVLQTASNTIMINAFDMQGPPYSLAASFMEVVSACRCSSMLH